MSLVGSLCEVVRQNRSAARRWILRIRRLLLHGGYPDDSWFWALLSRYRDAHGRLLEEAEQAWMAKSDVFASEVERHEFLTTDRWMLSPRPERGVASIVSLIEAFHHPSDPFTYLEFGVCFGTTFA